MSSESATKDVRSTVVLSGYFLSIFSSTFKAGFSISSPNET